MKRKKLLILEVIDAIGEVVKVVKDNQVTRQSIDHANKLFLETVKNKEEMIEFLDTLLSLEKEEKLTKSMAKRICSYITSLLRDQLSFDKACLEILEKCEL